MSAGMSELAAGRLRTECLSPEADEYLPAFVAVRRGVGTKCLSPEADEDLPAFVAVRRGVGTECLSPEADEDLPAFVAVMGVLSAECLSPEADADLPALLCLFGTTRICFGIAMAPGPTHFLARRCNRRTEEEHERLRVGFGVGLGGRRLFSAFGVDWCGLVWIGVDWW